jgi:hypothetical protein
MSTTPKSTADLLVELDAAKDAVQSCLDNPNVSVNFHGIAYWAGRVESLRAQIKDLL